MAGQCVLSLASSQMVSKGKVLYFSHCLRAFHRLLLLLFRFFRLPQRMEGSLTDLIRERERIPTQEIDMIIPQRGKTFHIFQRTIALTTSPRAPSCSSCPSRYRWRTSPFCPK